MNSRLAACHPKRAQARCRAINLLLFSRFVITDNSRRIHSMALILSQAVRTCSRIAVSMVSSP